MKIDPGSNPIQNLGVNKYLIQEKGEEKNQPDTNHLSQIDNKRVNSPLPFDLFNSKKTLEGDIKFIVLKKQGNGWIKIEDENGDSQKIQISKKTGITLDGIEAQLADLKEGDTVVVKVSGNKAVSLEATSTPLTLTGLLQIFPVSKVRIPPDPLKGLLLVNGVEYPITFDQATVQVKLNGITTTYDDLWSDPRVIQYSEEHEGGILIKAQFASNGTEIIGFNVFVPQ